MGKPKGPRSNPDGGQTKSPARMRIVPTSASNGEAPKRPRGPVTIFHNPRCSTSRKVLDRLVEAGLDPIVVDYLKEPPSALTLAEIARKAGVHPRDMIRTKEPEFAALRRPLDELSAAAAIAAMVEHPVLIQRPIVIRGPRALIARPPERVDELMGPPAPVFQLQDARASATGSRTGRLRTLKSGKKPSSRK